MQQQNSQIKNQIPHRKTYNFNEPKQSNIFFNSCFDSGNMSKVNKNSYDHYSIWTASDAEGTLNQGYPKSWFYFQAGGFINRKIYFSVHRVHFLWSVSKKSNIYRPVYKIIYQDSQTQWQRLPQPIISFNVNDQQELVLKFDFYFKKQIKSVKFAFLYPYSYQQQRTDILKLKSIYQQGQDKQIFFKQYQLIKSYQKRIVDMILISSHQGKDGFQNIKFDQYFDFGQKLIKFRDNKPIIFVSARVHPIQTPSSFCMNGIIKFLLDKNDYRAYLLRKYFVFILVPMLNPDGVSNGHCRMDYLNQNLNRYYKNPDPIKQPSCYAIRKLCQHYQKDKRMFMYLDLHAHPAHKGNFMFGNAIYDFIQQVQSQLFPKILSQNCINFQFENCIFSRKHMKAKDRNQDLNKQGCGRVVFYKDFGIPHAYTLQCGYHTNAYNNIIQPQTNQQNKFIIRYKLLQNGQKIYENSQKLYSQQKLAKIIQTIKKPFNKNDQQKDKQIQDLQLKSKIKKDVNIGDSQKQQKQIDSGDEKNKNGLKIQQPKNLKRHSNITNMTITTKNNKLSLLNDKNNINRTKNIYNDGYDIFQYTSSKLDNINDIYYKKEITMYNIQAYQNIGRNILITILDIFNKNPYSRSIDLNQRRKQIAQRQSKLDRFRKQQAGIRNKMKNIVQLIQQQFYAYWHKKNVFTFTETNIGSNNKNINNRRNNTITNHIINSSQSKARRNTDKLTQNQYSKRQIIQNQITKNMVSSQNNEFSLCKTSLNKLSIKQNENRNLVLSKKIKTIKSRQKGMIKQLSLKDTAKEDFFKKTIPMPSSQSNIGIESSQISMMKNQPITHSSKIIKSQNNNLTNLKTKNLILQGTNNPLLNYMGTQQYNNLNNVHAHSLGTQQRK